MLNLLGAQPRIQQRRQHLQQHRTHTRVQLVVLTRHSDAAETAAMLQVLLPNWLSGCGFAPSCRNGSLSKLMCAQA